MSGSDKVKETFGNEIRQKRRELHCTQQEIALRCDMSTRFYQYLEKGTRTPSLVTIFRLADALETDPCSLIETSWKKWKKKKK